MNPPELKEGIDKALKTLRQCDTQATAVKWMADAYKLMEACLPYLEPPRDASGSVVFTFKRPEIVIAHAMPKARVFPPKAPNIWANGQTVVYPEAFLHPGLKPAPRAWTHADTLRLERAAKMPPQPIQRRGR